jgi:hypothetical protein
MFYIKIHEDLPQGEFPQREERLRKTFFVLLCAVEVEISRVYPYTKA